MLERPQLTAVPQLLFGKSPSSGNTKQSLIAILRYSENSQRPVHQNITVFKSSNGECPRFPLSCPKPFPLQPALLGMVATLRLILGDQLNINHPWFEQADDDVLYLMMEMRQETDYVRHHIQKVAGFFSAMRAFAALLREQGHNVLYLTILDPDNRQNLPDNLHHVLKVNGIQSFEYQLPDEYRLDQQLQQICREISAGGKAVDTHHFLTSRHELAEMFAGKKTYLMERFYREMRKRFHIMIDDHGEPTGGQWNFDADNRNRYDGKVPVPDPTSRTRNVAEVMADIREAGIETFGHIEPERFVWPFTRSDALRALEDFLNHRLPYFGTYQDAMDNEEWSLFHARLSFPLNVKLISPLEVVERAVAHWQAHQDRISLPQIEGFVRQIIGWREYMRGVYWAHMPEFAEKNFFSHNRPLPGWYWTGETKMNCLSTAIRSSLDHAYAHHIQRLMVTGNFALLAGVDPDQLDEWYLGIYIDAIEWVEITNTRGMSQFADGGLVGSKPYVSSANYMHKMSNHCKSCHYDHKKRHGEGACPFNSLYWHFYQRHEEQLSNHPRIGFAYRNLARMKAEEREKIMQQAEKYLSILESL